MQSCVPRLRPSRYGWSLLVAGLVSILVGVEALTAGPERLETSHLANLKWRHIGPAIASGRTVDLAVFEKNPKIVYAATATGGIWKTTNNGVTWAPVFENGGTASLGAIAVSAQDPNLVWVGSGEAWSMRSNSWGDGVYKSTDGGRTWQHMGLEKTQHVGRILIHPTDASIVYVAAMGALWSSNEERGVYKTSDGGKTWTRALFISQYSGVADLAMDPTDPNTIYAAAFQRERRFYSFVGGGPDGGLYKTTDGGKTWRRLTNGLPGGDVGRIGVSVCRSAPTVVYAAVRAHDGGFYRSDDRGATWERRTADVQTHSGYGQVRCDPNDPNIVYVLDNRSHVTRDGGKTFRDDLTPGGAVHGDDHALWIDPADSDHMVLGNDGGIYITYDRGRTWDFMDQVSVAQFYAIAVDMREPFYYVYGGTQDNSSWGGPSGTRQTDGITNADWFLTSGGDGFYAQVDPTDPDIVYSESQYGRLLRLDLRTGERRLIQPAQPLTGEPHRWNWSVPLLISPHDHNTLYFGANVLFRSTNRGDAWTIVSPDLTRRLDPYQLPLQGKVQPRDALDLRQSTADYGNISTISESPLRHGLLAVGTDDGLVQVTRDEGQTWAKIDRLPGVPERAYVTRVVLSRFDEQTLYVTFSRHQDNDFAPYALKSTDLGKTWSSIAGDLPASGSVRVIAEHPRNSKLLFIGTEMGVFVSNTGGTDWAPLKNNLPTVPVHDLLVHPRENDLVIATHGRGFWILDDIEILDELTPETLAGQSHLARIRPALQFHPNPRNRSSMGDAHFTAPNPPAGAIITYYVNPSLASAETQIEVQDEAGELVRRLAPPRGGPAGGVQRVVWDLRHGLPSQLQGEDEGDGFRRQVRGPFVMPGQYRVRVGIGGRQHTQPVQVKGDPLVTVTTEERRVWRDTLLAMNHMYATALGAVGAAGELQKQLDAARQALERAGRGGAEPLVEQISAVRAELARIARAIRRPPAPRAATRSAEQEPREAIADEISQVASAIESWTGAPTADQRRLARENHERLTTEVGALNRAITEKLPALGASLAEHGVRLAVTIRPIVIPREASLPSGPQ